MLDKTDWIQYLHAIRKREIDLVFSLLPQTHFTSGLEIGAGDGFQTTLLAPHIDKLISSDLNFKRIKKSLKVTGVEYKMVDADAIEGIFKPNSFDFIFSSNVLEHVRDPQKVLKETREMLVNDGYAVHIIPSRHIKIFYLLFYYPNLILLVVDRIFGKLRGKPIFRGGDINLENNINAPLGDETAKWRKFLFPSVHGNFKNHIEEFVAFGKKQWERKFTEAGYSIISYAKGPAFSGYGFGFSMLRKLLEHFGVSSEHIFILKRMSRFEADTWAYTRKYLSHGSFRDQKKFVKDWLNKDKSAKAFFNDFVQVVGNPRGKKVLDIGFGNGIMAREFIKAGAVVYGLETEEELVKMSRNPNLYLYDGRKFPFDQSSFDYAYSTSVLEHMSYPEDVIKEIGRTLKPGGKFYLSFPNRYAPKETHTGLWFISWLPRFKSSRLRDWNLHFVSFFDLKKMAKRAGLRIVYDTHSQSFIRRSVKKILAQFGVHYGVLLKTIILVLEKPINYGKS
ncbi:MAG: methyltransferase domain-containing protein [Candidatus Zambryskibacteria bacterium]|nr:methyltransferase domain-containing protein [Candidatus Zambryskibacteria bacterium]